MSYDGYGYYGYGSYAYGNPAPIGGYETYGPFYRYNASGSLYGPGSAAYHQYQNATSYAYEGQNGSIFLRNTYTSSNSYDVDTSYSYNGDGRRISYTSDFHSSTVSFGSGIYYGQYSSYYGYYGTHEFIADAEFSYSRSYSTTSGNYSTFYDVNGSYATRSDGSYADSVSTFGASSYDGHVIAGSESHGTTTTAYDAYSGYSYHGTR